MNIPQFVHSATNRHLDCIWLGKITNFVATNILKCVLVYLYIYMNLLGIYPGVQFLDYRVCTYIFSFVDIAKQFSKVVVLIVNIFPSRLMRLSTFSCAYDHVDIRFCEGPVQVSSRYCLAVSTKAEYADILSSGNFAPVFLFSCLSFSY